jgi:hypothetical protein
MSSAGATSEETIFLFGVSEDDGVLIVTIVGSITCQLVASAVPVAFLSNPLV